MQYRLLLFLVMCFSGDSFMNMHKQIISQVFFAKKNNLTEDDITNNMKILHKALTSISEGKKVNRDLEILYNQLNNIKENKKKN